MVPMYLNEDLVAKAGECSEGLVEEQGESESSELERL